MRTATQSVRTDARTIVLARPGVDVTKYISTCQEARKQEVNNRRQEGSGNHEVWTTCPVCGFEYDARKEVCCV